VMVTGHAARFDGSTSDVITISICEVSCPDSVTIHPLPSIQRRCLPLRCPDRESCPLLLLRCRACRSFAAAKMIMDGTRV